MRGILTLFTFLALSSNVWAKSIEECRTQCTNAADQGCFTFGLGSEHFTEILVQLWTSAQANHDGNAGNICGRNTIVSQGKISNSGPECSRQLLDGAPADMRFTLRKLVDGSISARPDGSKDILFSHSPELVGYDNGQITLGGNILFVTSGVEPSTNERRLIWGTPDNQCFSAPLE